VHVSPMCTHLEGSACLLVAGALTTGPTTSKALVLSDRRQRADEVRLGGAV
jgi:hypothetical protein